MPLLGTVSERQLRLVAWLSLLPLLLPLAGCDRDSVLKPFGYDRAKLLRKLVPQNDETVARQYAEGLRQRRFEQIENDFDSNLKNPDFRQTLADMADLFPPSREPLSAKLVDARVLHRRDSSRMSSLTFEYEFEAVGMPANEAVGGISRDWLLTQVVLQTNGTKTTLRGLHVTPVSESVEVSNAFTFDGKGPSQYLALLLAIAASAFSFYVFVRCARTKPLKRKWLWLILIPLGVCKFTVNWTTGQWYFTPLNIQVPPGHAFCSPYGPWLLGFSIPVAALIFALRERNLTHTGSNGNVAGEGIAKDGATSADTASAG